MRVSLALIFLGFCFVGCTCYGQVSGFKHKVNICFDVTQHYQARAELLINQNKPDSALIILEQLYTNACEKNRMGDKCYALKEMGVVAEIMGDYPKSLEYLFEALSIAETNGFFNLEAAIHINIGIVYFNLKNPAKAIESYTKALMLGENMGDTLLIIKSVNNLGNVHLTLLYEWEKAEAFFNKSVLLARTIGFEQAELIGLNNLSQVYMNSGRENEALNVTRQMLELYPDNPYIYYNLANLYRQKQQTAKALGFYNTALELSVFETELKLILLMDMSEIYSELRDFENSMLFYRRFNQLRDSIHSIEALKSSKEIEARYENLKKEKEIFELNNKTLKAERSIGYIVFSAVTVGFLLIVLVLFVNQKKKIVQQKLKQSESEKLAVVAHAGLEGEEKERSRLAKELHDGLGGMLTAVQLEIETHNANTQPAHSNNSKSLNMLQQSIAELRRISNALLPEALLKTGLNNALKHYCLSFNLVSKSTEITYLFSGIETSFSKPFELTVYRICQELLNNAVKHSRATHVEVQLIVESNRVFLSVTDNGIGFDVESAMLNQSVGLKSIVQRVEIYGGRFEIVSQPDSGTEAIAEFENIAKNSLIRPSPVSQIL